MPTAAAASNIAKTLHSTATSTEPRVLPPLLLLLLLPPLLLLLLLLLQEAEGG